MVGRFRLAKGKPREQDRYVDVPVDTPEQSGRLGWLVLTAIACLALLFLSPVYDTNDDPLMAGLLSGQYYGSPSDAIFLDHNLSAILMRLYTAVPGISWYGIFMESCNIVSALLWASLIITLVQRPADRLVLLGGLLIGYGYLVLRVNFMAVASSLFLSAAGWLWKLQLERAPVRWPHTLLGVALGAAHMIRPTLRDYLAFFFVPVLLVSAGRRNLTRLLVVAVPAAALIMSTRLADQAFRVVPENQTYIEFNAARSSLLDRPHVCTPDALAAAGWSPADYYQATVGKWFHDNQIFNARAIHAYIRTAPSFEPPQNFLDRARIFGLKRYHLLSLAVLACCVAWMWLGPVQGRPRAPLVSAPVRWAIWLWLVVGLLVLVVYRFGPRVYVPLYLYFGTLALLVPPITWFRRLHGSVVAITRRVAGICVPAGLLFSLIYWCYDAGAGVLRVEILARELRAGVEQLGKPDLLVAVGSMFETPYTTVMNYSSSDLGARVPPTGWVIGSPAYRLFLREIGFESGRAMVRGLISNPRAVFVVRLMYLGEAERLLEYLGEHYADGGRLEIETVLRINGPPSLVFFRINRR